MALIVCPECEGKISEYANMCFHCGCPMDVIKELMIKNKATIVEEEKKVVAIPKRKIVKHERIEFTEENSVLFQTWLDVGIVLEYDGCELDLIDIETFEEYINDKYEDENLSYEELDKIFYQEALGRNIKTLNRMGLSREEVIKYIDEWKKRFYM